MCQNKVTGAAACKEVFHPGRIHLFIQQIQDLVQDKDSLSFPFFFRISTPPTKQTGDADPLQLSLP